MDKDDKPSGSVFKLRNRCPTFSHEEVEALLNIIDKYKQILFNKCTNAVTNNAKEITWQKIAKIFNRQGFTHHRSADKLRTKVENLKREIKKSSKNVMDGGDDPDDLLARLLAMMCEAENNTSLVGEPIDSDKDLNDTEEQKDKTDELHWNGDESEDRNSDNSDDGEAGYKSRSANFSSQECNLLLKCVRQEKHHIFSKMLGVEANKLKNGAWSRVTNSYNKLSPQKRSTKMLRTKFENMKKMTKNINFQGYFRDIKKKNKREDSDMNIKSEPLFDFGEDIVSEHDFIVQPDDQMDVSRKSDDLTPSLDPLNTVLSSDSGIGSGNLTENNEVVKLKLELLNFELETAKLQRKRIEELAKAEAAEREAKAIESSMRLRAARLEVISAEMRLPATHHALTYTPQESKAQNYILQYNMT